MVVGGVIMGVLTVITVLWSYKIADLRQGLRMSSAV